MLCIWLRQDVLFDISVIISANRWAVLFLWLNIFLRSDCFCSLSVDPNDSIVTCTHSADSLIPWDCWSFNVFTARKIKQPSFPFLQHNQLYSSHFAMNCFSLQRNGKCILPWSMSLSVLSQLTALSTLLLDVFDAEPTINVGLCADWISGISAAAAALWGSRMTVVDEVVKWFKLQLSTHDKQTKIYHRFSILNLYLLVTYLEWTSEWDNDYNYWE